MHSFWDVDVSPLEIPVFQPQLSCLYVHMSIFCNFLTTPVKSVLGAVQNLGKAKGILVVQVKVNQFYKHLLKDGSFKTKE